MLNTISVDVEEYFHATNLEPWIGPAKWHTLPSRVEYSVRRLLEIFREAQTKGTFFVLGSVARRWPSVIREISAAGHEIASHGYAHRLAYEQTPKKFFRDVYRTKHLLEELCGSQLLGYRAPNFSIRDANAWAYDELLRAGYQYDSSLYPVRHQRYGNRDKARTPFFVQRQDGSLLIVPLATTEFHCGSLAARIPIAGGAYWRLLPKSFISWALKRTNEKEGIACHCYLHPWEIDPAQPRFRELPYLIQLRHYSGITAMDKRLEHFLKHRSFVPIREVVKNMCQDLH